MRFHSLSFSLINFFLLVVLWFAASVSIYAVLFPSSGSALLPRQHGKSVEAFLLLTLAVLPFLIQRMARFEIWVGLSKWLFDAGLIVGLAVSALFYGAISTAFFALLLWAMTKIPSFKASLGWTIGYGVLAVVLAVALFQINFRRIALPLIDPYHDGSALAAVQAFLQGKHPGRDFTLYYGILRELGLPLLSMKWSAPAYIDFARGTLALQAAAPVAMLFVLQAAVRNRLLVICAFVLFILRTEFYLLDRVLFILLSMGCLIQGFRLRWPGWAVLAGSAYASQFLYSIDVALAFGLGTALFFALTFQQTRKHLIYFLIGAGSVLMLFAGYLLAVGGLIPFIRDTFAMLFVGSADWTGLFKSHIFLNVTGLNEISLRTYLGMHSVPVLAVGLVAYLYWKKTDDGIDLAGLLLALVSFSGFFLYLAVPDIRHWRKATPFLVPLLVWGIAELWRWLKQAAQFGLTPCRSLATAVILMMPAISLLLGSFKGFSFISHGVSALQALPSVFTPNPASPQAWAFPRLGDYPENFEDVRPVQELITLVQTHVPPKEPFFDLSGYGGLYFLADRENPTRYALYRIIFNQRMMSDCISSLERRPPAAVMVYYEKGKIRFEERFRPLFAYIEERYEPHDPPSEGRALLLPKARREI